MVFVDYVNRSKYVRSRWSAYDSARTSLITRNGVQIAQRVNVQITSAISWGIIRAAPFHSLLLCLGFYVAPFCIPHPHVSGHHYKMSLLQL